MKGIIIALVVILIVGGGLYLTGSFQDLGAIATGGTVRQVGQADFLSNDPDLQGRAWLLDISLDGRNQYFVGTEGFEAGNIDSGNFKSENDVKIETFVDKEQCEYVVNPSSDFLYHHEYEIKQFFELAIDFQDRCKTRDNYIIIKPAFSIDQYCIWTTNERLIGSLGTPFTAFEATVRVTSDGQSEEGVISNFGAGQFITDDKRLAAFWTGNTVSGEQCPLALEENVIAYYDGVWRVSDSRDYQTWRNDYLRLENCISNDPVTICVDNLNGLERQAAAIKFDIGGYPVSSAGTSDSGKVIARLDHLMQFPQLTIKLDADWIGWVGIVQESGKPVITSISSTAFKQNGYIYFTVLNDGEGAGAFEATVSCDPPFLQSGGAVRFELTPSQFTQESIAIEATTDTRVDAFCTLTVIDRNNPSIRTSQKVAVTALPAGQICVPGQKRCNINLIEVCNAAGTSWTTFEICEGGTTCVYDKGVPVCAFEGDDSCSGIGQSCDLKACCEGLVCGGGILGVGKTCQTEEPNYNWIWIIIVAVLLALLGYIAAGYLGAGVGAIIGGIIGYGVYWFLGLEIWQQWLLGIAGAGGTILLLYVGGAAIFAIIIAIIASRR